ncbi:hypothetical protein H7X46_15345 [Pseudonocardia sp. C8]|uniref:hypothetical protein n=1 Tax=Pseudonocardia sp. C8 TaxID=2762759 RepID=UPI0016430B31|nr:hypothetical protein [Pseudonocardia sp. C8]MBC3192440.1 hypothetical protein [Pseudonocardia sp. C8]
MREDDGPGVNAFALAGLLLAAVLAAAALLLAVAPATPAGATGRVEQAGMSSGCAGGPDAVLFGLVCAEG